MSEMTNILIVGNGFDLSHFLPTKYDHFMDVMQAIEASKSDLMNFDDLFSKCRDEWFIVKTKQYYLTENIDLPKDQLSVIRDLLKENCWYHYFKNHVQEVKTWIDFEKKIEAFLVIVASCISDINSIQEIDLYKYFESNKKEGLRIGINHEKKLSFFDFIAIEKYEVFIQAPLLKKGVVKPTIKYDERKNINPKFCYGNNIHNGFDPSKFIQFMYDELENFIKIFDLYLDLIVSQLVYSSMFEIKSELWIEPDKIFSFNYTNTYQRIYDSVEVDYLHGSHGECQNIVLGISDIEGESLKKIKAYGFTKYHQRLFKGTDYIFLDKFKKIIEDGKRGFDEDLKLLSANALNEISARFIKMGNGRNKINLNLNFQIWGHSLDESDREYILDLFSLNDDMDRNVRVIVYYFNNTAKFDLLNNLLHILGKDKVEKWMKNKWLEFHKNPEIDFGV